jgi:hypothetical protein
MRATRLPAEFAHVGVAALEELASDRLAAGLPAELLGRVPVGRVVGVSRSDGRIERPAQRRRAGGRLAARESIGRR